MLQIGSLVKIHIFGKFKIRVEISNWNQLAKIASNQKSIIDDDGLWRAQQQQRVNSTVIIILFNLDNSENRISFENLQPFLIRIGNASKRIVHFHLWHRLRVMGYYYSLLIITKLSQYYSSRINWINFAKANQFRLNSFIITIFVIIGLESNTESIDAAATVQNVCLDMFIKARVGQQNPINCKNAINFSITWANTVENVRRNFQTHINFSQQKHSECVFICSNIIFTLICVHFLTREKKSIIENWISWLPLSFDNVINVLTRRSMFPNRIIHVERKIRIINDTAKWGSEE